MNYKRRSQFNSIIQIIILFIVITITFWLLIRGLDKPLIQLEERDDISYIYIEDNTIKPINPAFYLIETKVLGSVVETHYENDTTITGLVEDLIQCESSGNPNAYNPRDPITESIGILQYKRGTFRDYCVNKYKLASSVDEIWNSTTQIQCCVKMLEDGGSSHWATCWNKINK